uniref:Uncharacterized protein n=1 Tax=Zea mays TaxID=4577 RepID=A0A804LV44_MAIZE
MCSGSLLLLFPSIMSKVKNHSGHKPLRQGPRGLIFATAPTPTFCMSCSRLVPTSLYEDKRSRRNEESCSFTSSNRESWGRCSSLGAASDELFSGNNNDKQI